MLLSPKRVPVYQVIYDGALVGLVETEELAKLLARGILDRDMGPGADAALCFDGTIQIIDPSNALLWPPGVTPSF